jgi:hypothetical protein
MRLLAASGGRLDVEPTVNPAGRLGVVRLVIVVAVAILAARAARARDPLLAARAPVTRQISGPRY